MTDARTKPDGIDALLARLSHATDQITKASEKQAREIDRQLKRIIDRGEASTERMLKAIDKELTTQIGALRRELKDLERRVSEAAKPARAAGKKALARKPAPKKAPAKRSAAKKTAAKKAPAKKSPAKRTAAKKAPAKKTGKSASRKAVAR